MERKEIPISKKFFIDVNGNIFDSNGKLKIKLDKQDIGQHFI